MVDSVHNHQRGPAYADAAMARVYVWLRYSATRQLTWQRHYNTQPRILSAAQDRLTGTLAEAVRQLPEGEARLWARQCLTTVGRGGDGQKIRDEILNIMHRNKIKEEKGTWMEEWHQKLHNNTTPDDVGICEAYLAFLESGGDVDTYWRTLADHGLSRARLESFDRAIRMEPEYWVSHNPNPPNPNPPNPNPTNPHPPNPHPHNPNPPNPNPHPHPNPHSLTLTR